MPKVYPEDETYDVDQRLAHLLGPDPLTRTAEAVNDDLGRQRRVVGRRADRVGVAVRHDVRNVRIAARVQQIARVQLFRRRRLLQVGIIDVFVPSVSPSSSKDDNQISADARPWRVKAATGRHFFFFGGRSCSHSKKKLRI